MGNPVPDTGEKSSSSQTELQFSDTVGVHMVASLAGTSAAFIYVSQLAPPSGNEVFMHMFWPILLPLACIPGALFYLVFVFPFASAFQAQSFEIRWIAVPLATTVAAAVPYLQLNSAVVAFALCAFVGSLMHLLLFSLFSAAMRSKPAQKFGR